MRSSRLALALLALPTLAVATTLVPHTLQQRAENADRVALVQVLSQHVEHTPGAVVPIKTYTRVAVGSDFKGTGPAEFTIVQLGGTVGAESLTMPGDARFALGETAVVFVRCRLAVDRCHLVAAGAGKLDVAGEDVFVQDLFNGKWSKVSLSSFGALLRAPQGGAR
ncbi:MAG: hypothetical protein ACOZQL_29270 [Myxococcota bacterium]